MTAVAPTHSFTRTHRAPVHRIGATVRIHVANPWTTLISPWLILLVVFGLNFAIWHLVLMAAGDRGVEADAFHYNGGVSWIVFYMVVVAVQAMNQTFSFVVGLGATRRDYFVGTSALFAGLALMYGIGVSVLAGVERATSGWGVNGWFFAPGPFATMPLWEVAVTYTLVLLFMFFVGSGVAAVFVRWGATGILTFFASVAVLLLATLWAITQADAWASVGHFFTARSPLELALLSLPLSLVGGLVGYGLMRRATPKG